MGIKPGPQLKMPMTSWTRNSESRPIVNLWPLKKLNLKKWKWKSQLSRIKIADCLWCKKLQTKGKIHSATRAISIDNLIKPIGQTGASNNFKNGVICIYCKILGHHQQECHKRIKANKPLPGWKWTTLLAKTQHHQTFASATSNASNNNDGLSSLFQKEHYEVPHNANVK
jgi:hypothetical protein